MSFLYLTEQGSTLRKKSNRLVVEKDQNILLEVPCLKLESVLIFGNVQVTTQALSELLAEGIELAFLTETGRLKGQLTPTKSKNVELRVAQYEKARDTNFCFKFSQKVLDAKLKNSIEVLRRFSYNHPEIKLDNEIEIISRFKNKITLVERMEQLLGIEGAAARSYFCAFGKMILKDIDFPGRRRRPPTDPMNSLLSLGYTLLTNEIHWLLDGMGLDPYIGFFHKIEYGRPSLALDLTEEFRQAIVDRFSLYLINKEILTKEDFQKRNGTNGIYLKRESLKKYLRCFEKWMTQKFKDQRVLEKTDLRKRIRDQAEKLARLVRRSEDKLSEEVLYDPFVIK